MKSSTQLNIGIVSLYTKVIVDKLQYDKDINPDRIHKIWIATIDEVEKYLGELRNVLFTAMLNASASSLKVGRTFSGEQTNVIVLAWELACLQIRSLYCEIYFKGYVLAGLYLLDNALYNEKLQNVNLDWVDKYEDMIKCFNSRQEVDRVVLQIIESVSSVLIVSKRLKTLGVKRTVIESWLKEDGKHSMVAHFADLREEILRLDWN